MASGPEHYRDAERNIEYAKDAGEGSAKKAFHLKLALIHATLANAAATALSQTGPDGSYYPRDEVAWHEAAGTKDTALQPPRHVTYDMTDTDRYTVLTTALAADADQTRDTARNEGGNPSLERFAGVADQMLREAEEARNG